MPLKKFRRGKRPFLVARDGLQHKEKILVHSHILLLCPIMCRHRWEGSPNNDRILAFTETGVSWRFKWAQTGNQIVISFTWRLWSYSFGIPRSWFSYFKEKELSTCQVLAWVFVTVCFLCICAHPCMPAHTFFMQKEFFPEIKWGGRRRADSFPLMFS